MLDVNEAVSSRVQSLQTSHHWDFHSPSYCCHQLWLLRSDQATVGLQSITRFYSIFHFKGSHVFSPFPGG